MYAKRDLTDSLGRVDYPFGEEDQAYERRGPAHRDTFQLRGDKSDGNQEDTSNAGGYVDVAEHTMAD